MQELVVESLVVSLTMVMRGVLVDNEASMPLAERDDAREALLFTAHPRSLRLESLARKLQRPAVLCDSAHDGVWRAGRDLGFDLKRDGHGRTDQADEVRENLLGDPGRCCTNPHWPARC